jgi:hypothetical protein
MKQVVVSHHFVSFILHLYKISFNAVLCAQHLVPELWHHVKLLKHTYHVANVS